MSEIRVDTISEKTSANGVAIDSVTLKDGGATLTDNITFSASGKGVHLGVTSATASNLLDDYEEGTFTPTLNGTSGGASGVSYNARLGWYEKIGHNVQAHIWLDAASMSSVPTGNLTVTNLPFTSKNTTNFNNSIALSYSANFSSSTSPQGGYLSPNATSINIIRNSTSDSRSGLETAVPCSDMSGDEKVMIFVSYRTE